MSVQSLEPTPAVAQKAMRVLVVDDDAAVRTVLCEVHPRRGVRGGRPSDRRRRGRIARAVVSPDGILLDVRMPRMGGIDAAREILSRLPSVRIVMLSAYDDASMKAEARQAGASAFLVKGCPLAELIDAVHP